MDFDITKVTIDGDVDDLSEEQLRELVGKFQDAQESNVAEFERAAEAMDEVDEDTIEDFEQARESLIEEIADAEAFGEVPLDEEDLEDEDFSDLQDWREFVAGGGAGGDDPEDDEPEEDAEFDDFGTESPADPGDDEYDFVEEELQDVPGLSL